MKFFIVLSAVLMPILATTNNGLVNLEQDSLGNYNLKVETPEGNRQEQRKADGSIAGSYTFIDSNGKPIIVEYQTIDGGFQIKNPTAVVVDTDEVRAAREEHLKAYAKQEAEIRSAPKSLVAEVEEKPIKIEDVLAQLTVIPKLATLPSSDVPEVDADHYAKKAELMKSYAEALEKLAQEYRTRQ